MALTYIGETEFVQSGPPQWQQSTWDLDTLIISYSGSQPNLDSFLNSLEKGSPSDIDGDMYLMDWRISGTKAYPQVDLVYIGKKNGELPPVKRVYGNPIQSSSSTRSVGLSSPTNATLEFYAVTSQATWYTYDAPGSLGTAADPSGSPTPRFLVTDSGTYGPGTAGFDDTLATFFATYITDTLDSEEIVANKLWRNQETKTKYYGPFAYVFHDGGGGKTIALYAPGTGYTVSDSLSFSYGGGSAAITVTSVDGAGGVSDFSIDSDSISAPFFLVITATGGTGSGAQLQFFGA